MPTILMRLGLAVARERKVWTRTRLTELGVERSALWGWPNIYTYTKALGEQLVAAETGMVRSIVRPEHRRIRPCLSLPGLERRLHHHCADHFSRPERTDADSREREVDSRHHAGRSSRGGDARGRGAGMRRRAAAGPSGRHRRFESQQHGPHHRPRRSLQAKDISRRKRPASRLLNEIAARMEPRPVSTARFETSSMPMFNCGSEESFVAA